MTVTAVVGMQWGDEAKGKLVDILSQDADIVARFNGGDNAGHTVVNEYGTFKLRLTPNGFYNPKTTCIIGSGVVVNLSTLISELEIIQASGINIENRLWISPRCNVVMPWHPMLESIYEKAKGKARTGTTRRGMGPVYADKVSYNGIRLFDLFHKDTLADKLSIQLAIKNPIFQAFGEEPLNHHAVLDEKLGQFDKLRAFVREPFGILQEALARQAKIVLEGAQGALLDNNWGTYPYCTASTTLAGGASASLGIAPHSITRVIGVVKAYTTRVGAGPMPTELHDEIGETLQREGQEFGTVTSRPRRCGWFDAELVKFTAKINGATEIALTKLDVLDSLPSLKICIGYTEKDDDAQQRHYWEGDAQWLGKCQPVYTDMVGWGLSTREVKAYTQLPCNAQKYVDKIGELAGVPVRYISVGPEREETIQL